MSKRQFVSVRRKFTPEERQRFEAIKAAVERDLPRHQREAQDAIAQMEAAFAAVQVLKRERQSRGISLNELARRTGITKGNLSRLENDVNANPTLETITRIARAIGGTIEFVFRPAA